MEATAPLFPNEILLEIARQVEDGELKNARAVSGIFYQALSPRFRSMHFTERVHTFTVAGLRELVQITGNQHCTSYVQTLILVQTGRRRPANFQSQIQAVFRNLAQNNRAVSVGFRWHAIPEILDAQSLLDADIRCGGDLNMLVTEALSTGLTLHKVICEFESPSDARPFGRVDTPLQVPNISLTMFTMGQLSQNTNLQGVTVRFSRPGRRVHAEPLPSVDYTRTTNRLESSLGSIYHNNLIAPWFRGSINVGVSLTELTLHDCDLSNVALQDFWVQSHATLRRLILVDVHLHMPPYLYTPRRNWFSFLSMLTGNVTMGVPVQVHLDYIKLSGLWSAYGGACLLELPADQAVEGTGAQGVAVAFNSAFNIINAMNA